MNEEPVFQFPTEANITEDSFERSDPRVLSTDINEATFTVIDNATKRGHAKLFEKTGFAYTFYRSNSNYKSKLYLFHYL